MEDLAEQSIDELLEIQAMDEKVAADLIMTARAPWFADDASQDQETNETSDAEEKQ
jgi:N utilization substance protein A